MAAYPNYGGSQTSPFTDPVQANNPAFSAGQQRRIQGQPNLGQAIQGGMPIGGTSPFAGAAQTLGNSPQANTMPMHRWFQGQQSQPQPTFPTSQPTGQTPVQGPNADQGSQSASSTGSSSTGGTNQDKFLAMLNDPANKGKSPQDIINQFNAMGLNADGSGLSSNYGSSPAYYSDGNAIGLPGAVLNQDPSTGQWTATARSGGGGNSGGQGFSNNNILSNAILGTQMGTAAQANNAGNPSAIWQQVLAQLQQAPQLK